MLNLNDEQRLRALLTDITAYMDHLRGDMGLRVTVHQIDMLAGAFMASLMPYNIHSLPYCSFMKSNPGVWRECVRRQKKLCQRLESGAFFGTCWAGVGEYVFPVFDLENEYTGFVCVSGYAGDPEKTRAQTEKISVQYDIPLSDIRRFQSGLKKERPSLEEVKVLLQPLVHMFALLQLYLRELDAQSSAGGDKTSNALFTQIRLFLRMNYAANFPLAYLAERYGCSESHLCHLFQKYAQCGSRADVNTMRVNIGKIYLADTDMDIQDISDLLGYSNSNYFSTVFRSAVGLSPRQYRNSLA